MAWRNTAPPGGADVIVNLWGLYVVDEKTGEFVKRVKWSDDPVQLRTLLEEVKALVFLYKVRFDAEKATQTPDSLDSPTPTDPSAAAERGGEGRPSHWPVVAPVELAEIPKEERKPHGG
tara:strand:+ start:160 stop:516 length:357 start_codon:yes stop_codon:yes gene_type:complete